ncbi:MAG: DNA mismatch repair protein MutL [Bacilli bacterium]|nr:DNA mismatch repair protein MutL [Bacilli bacterium]
MKVDALVYEIGSTTTLVNAFTNLKSDNPEFLGQGQARTTVLEGDVTIGLQAALVDLKHNLGVKEIEADEIYATSSAAGGLKMTVHGLVYDMTVKAAQNAALGAGANLHLITSGKLTETELVKIKSIKPNIILIAGGVDYGEKETALYNSEMIARLCLNIPVIYAGNCVIQDEVKNIFRNYQQDAYLFITENVYPRIDELNVLKCREIIQSVFEKHIIHAQGMEKVRSVVNHHIIPTPGAVMECAILLYERIGDLIVFDVGGATTDLHSVTPGNQDISKKQISPEPLAKRTVEGDLGVYINRHSIIDKIGLQSLTNELQYTEKELTEIINNYQVYPNNRQLPLVERLTYEAIKIALERHAGSFRNIYGASGRQTYAEGKDLTNVKYVIGTGGALTRLPNRIKILQRVLQTQNPLKLMPPKEAEVLIDHDYIMASCGVLSLKYPEAAYKLIVKSLKSR